MEGRKSVFDLTAGLVGLMCGVVEKAVLGNIASVLVGLAIPMHIIWQFNQGAHYFEYEKAKALGEIKAANGEWRLAVLLPFFLHGCWDSGLDLALYGVEREEVWPQVVGGVLTLALIVSGIWYCIRTVRKMRRIVREETAPAAAAKEGEA